MRKSRFAESQIFDVLKRAEGGIPVKDLCRELWFSSEGILAMSFEVRLRRSLGAKTYQGT